jgi:hypothetical protein
MAAALGEAQSRRLPEHTAKRTIVSEEYDPFYKKIRQVRQNDPFQCPSCMGTMEPGESTRCRTCPKFLCPDCAKRFRWLVCLYCRNKCRAYCSVTCARLNSTMFYHCTMCQSTGCALCVSPGPGSIREEPEQSALCVSCCMECHLHPRGNDEEEEAGNETDGGESQSGISEALGGVRGD